VPQINDEQWTMNGEPHAARNGRRRAKQRKEGKKITIPVQAVASLHCSQNVEGYLREAEDLGSQLIAFGRKVRQQGKRL